VAAHLTEEEQIEAVKRWWNENGKITVAVILAAALGWFGWNNWQDRQEQLAEQASMQYAELMAVVGGNQALTEKDQATAKLLAGEIVASQADTLYGNFAGFQLAKLAVNTGDLAEAEAQLRSTINQAVNPGIAKLANLRLARVLSAGGDHEAALALLNAGDNGAFSAAYAETRGDIYVVQNQLDLARTAYEQAVASLTPEERSRGGLIQLKLDNARVAGQDSPAADEAPMPATEGDA
jgi:predicted negative regulator of RcsB-dependent stress response